MSNDKIELSEQQKMLLDNMARDMGYHGDWCFYVAPDQDVEIYDGYIPAMVFRDVKSYFSMNGPLYGDVPFIIGQNLAEAKTRCKLMDDYIGLENDQVEDILGSARLNTN